MGDFLKLWFGGGFLELGLRWWVEEIWKNLEMLKDWLKDC